MDNKIPGYMTKEECAVLRTLFAQYNSAESIGVEIGSLHGRSSYEISHAIPLGKLYCIDGWDGYDSSSGEYTEEFYNFTNFPKKGTMTTLEFFKENVKDCKNIIPVKGYSPRDIKNWQLKVDFIFLDALHSNPSDWDNIKFWMPKIKAGGCLAGHDFYSDRSQWPDVHDNVRQLETQLQKKVSNPIGTSIWYFIL